MNRLVIICEGKTELQFARTLLATHLVGYGYDSESAQLLGQPGHQGGKVSWARLTMDLRPQLRSDAIITTLIDFYGLVGDFPGLDEAKRKTTTSDKARTVMTALAQATQGLGLGPDRFVPYIQMHEFEGLLFSDPATYAAALDQPRLADAFERIRRQFRTPEDINDGSATAPSKRVLGLMPGYRKVHHGNVAAERITLPAIRGTCELFNHWLTSLESLGSAGRSPGAA